MEKEITLNSQKEAGVVLFILNKLDFITKINIKGKRKSLNKDKWFDQTDIKILSL